MNPLFRVFPQLESTDSLIRRAHELRAMTANQAIADWWRSISLKTASGVIVDSKIASTSPTVQAAVRLIRAVGSSLPLHVLEPGPNGGSRRLRDHVAERLLNEQANPFLTSSAWRATMIDSLLLTGAHYSWCLRNGRMDPAALFPMSNVKVEWKPNDNVLGGMEPRYIGTRRTGNYKQELDLSADETLAVVIQVGEDGAPVNPTKGSELIGLELALESYGARVFGSSAGGWGVVLKSAKPLTATQDGQLTDKMSVEHEGLLNAHRMAVLGPDLSVERVAPVSKDLQHVEARRAIRAFIAGTFGTPNLLIGGDADQPIAKGQYSEITLSFVSYALVPLLNCIEQALEHTLLFSTERARGVRIKHELRDLLSGSPDDESIVLTRNVQAGVLTPNEARERLDLPRIAGGDALVTRDDDTPETRSVQSARRKAVQHDAIIRIAQDQPPAPVVIPAPIVNVVNQVNPTPVTVHNDVKTPTVNVQVPKKQSSKIVRDPKSKLIVGVEAVDSVDE